MTTYVFEPKWQHEHAGLRSLEATFHENTAAILAARGVTAGWSCLEVGAGAGGVARWLADRIGPSGRVVATDRDIRFLADLDDVREHDIATDPVLDERFDPAHAEALARMVAAVRPGGWMVVEDVTFEGAAAPDLMAACTAPDDLAASYRPMLSVVAAVFRAVGADPTYAVGLPARSAADEVEHAFTTLDGDNFHLPPLMVSAWGRRPTAGGRRRPVCCWYRRPPGSTPTR
jgi:predicted O-methyltransferase YrrM